MKKALITGVLGQDGSYLTELLLEKEYDVYGLYRRTSVSKFDRVEHLLSNPNFHLVEGDITDKFSIWNVLTDVLPDEIYNLAAQSHVQTSFKQPEYTTYVNYFGLMNILEWMKPHQGDYMPKLYHAGTSEEFGSNVSYRDDQGRRHESNSTQMKSCFARTCFQDEKTPFAPCSPYGISKLAAHQLARVYRDSYDVFVSVGILFNHESERRGEEFVTRKITKWAGKLWTWKDKLRLKYEDLNFDDDSVGYAGESYPLLKLGNLESCRDYGYAGDYVEAMHLMLQKNCPDDFVVASGETHSIKEFLTLVLTKIGIPLQDHHKFYKIDQSLYRPLEVNYLRGDSSKARKVLGWQPQVSFDEMVSRMVLSDSLI